MEDFIESMLGLTVGVVLLLIGAWLNHFSFVLHFVLDLFVYPLLGFVLVKRIKKGEPLS